MIRQKDAIRTVLLRELDVLDASDALQEDGKLWRKVFDGSLDPCNILPAFNVKHHRARSRELNSAHQYKFAVQKV